MRLAGELTETLCGFGQWDYSRVRPQLQKLSDMAGTLRHHSDLHHAIQDLANRLGFLISGELRPDYARSQVHRPLTRKVRGPVLAQAVFSDP